MSHLLLALTTATTTKAKSSSSSSSYSFLIIIVLFAGAYFLFIRPRQKRARATQSSSSTLAVGDEVISAGGILGVVVGILGDEIEVEVAPGMRLTFWRRAVNLRTSVRGAPQSQGAGDGVGSDLGDQAVGDHDFSEAHSGDADPGPADETGTLDPSHAEHEPDDPTRHGGAGGGA